MMEFSNFFNCRNLKFLKLHEIKYPLQTLNYRAHKIPHTLMMVCITHSEASPNIFNRAYSTVSMDRIIPSV